MSSTLGQPVRIPLSVSDPLTGLPTDATVSVIVTKPDGTTITPSVTHPALGQYETIVIPNLAGTWLYVWSVSGAVTGVDDGQFEVTAVQVRISSLAEIKLHLNKKLPDTTDDAELQDVADAAQAMIEREIGDVIPKSYAEYYTPCSSRIVTHHGPIVSLTSVTEYMGTSVLKVLTVTDYRLENSTSSIERLIGGFPAMFQGTSVLVSYIAGVGQPVPANIRLAHKELTAHLWRNSQMGRSRRNRGATPDDDLAQASPGFSMPNRVRELIGVKRPVVY